MGYLMPNPVFIYDFLNEEFVGNIFQIKQSSFVCSQLNGYKYFDI